MEPLVLRKRLFLLSLAVGLVAIALLAAWVAMRHAEAVHHRGGRPRGNEWHVGYDPQKIRKVYHSCIGPLSLKTLECTLWQ